ncbi:MAG TPA: hypothetical protein VLI54_04195 [Bacillota bacterium]|nr:hypothetical protein [Bacillota bacterium]
MNAVLLAPAPAEILPPLQFEPVYTPDIQDYPAVEAASSLPTQENQGNMASFLMACKRAGAAAMTACVAMMPVPARHELPLQPPPPPAIAEFNLPVYPLPGPEVKVCPAPPPEDIAFVDKLLSGKVKGVAPRMDKLTSKYKFEGMLKGMADPELSTDATERAYTQLKHEAASAVGLHVFDPQLDELERDLYPITPIQTPVDIGPPVRVKRGQLPFSVYYQQASEFLAQYGVDLVFHTPGKDDGGSLMGAEAPQLETVGAKQSLYYAMRYFANLPVELVQMVGLRHIVLDTVNPHPPKGSSGAAAFTYMGPHDTITINASGAIDPLTYGHEMGHDTGGATCAPDGDGNDPGYLALNGGVDYDVKDRPKDVDVETAFQEIGRLQSKAAEAFRDGNSSLAASLQAQVLAAQQKLAFISRAQNMAEDKADMRSKIFNTYFAYRDVTDDDQPQLEAKFVYLLAQIAQYNPAVASYLAIVGRPISNHRAGGNPTLNRLEGAWADVEACDMVTNISPDLVPATRFC